MVVKCCPTCKETLAVACKTCLSCGYIFQAKKVTTTKQSERLSITKEGRTQKIANYEDELVYQESSNLANSCINSVGPSVPISEKLGENSSCLDQTQMETKTENKMKDTVFDKVSTGNDNINNKPEKELENKLTPQIKKRGRPKGSKDKQKRLPKGYKQLKRVRNSDVNADAEWEIKESSNHSQSNSTAQSDKNSILSRKRGRPRGSRNKPSLSPLFYAEDDYDDEFDSDDRDDRCCQTENAFYIPPEKEEKLSLILEGINQSIVCQTLKT